MNEWVCFCIGAIISGGVSIGVLNFTSSVKYEDTVRASEVCVSGWSSIGRKNIYCKDSSVYLRKAGE